MPEVAATPTGGAEGSARPAPAASQPSQQTQQAKPSISDRLKAQLYPEPAPDEGRALPEKDKPQVRLAEDRSAEPATEDVAEDATAPNDEQVETDEAPTAADETAIKSLNELAEGLGWDLDKVLDLEASTKISGKDGKVRLRDLLKSHQLEGHLNQGLMKLAEERKAFEGETTRKVQEMQARVGQLSQAVTLAQKILDGEFADVNWPELQRTDPAAFQAKYGAYKMRFDGIQQLNQMAMQETERKQAEQQAAQQAYLAEQQTLLDSKLPEWSDKGKREKDVTEMVAIGSDAYGFTEQEVRTCADHRMILLLRDAAKWQKLQKSKPATLQKVRAAPKLIRPGSSQSRTAQDGLQYTKDRENLRRTGRPQDAVPALKKLLFQ